MKRSLKTWHAPLLAVALAIPLAASSAVNLTLDGMNSTLDNGVLKVRLGADGSAQEVWKGGVNLITRLSGAARDPDKNRSFYLDYYSGGVNEFVPERVSVISQTPDQVHLAYIDDQNGKLRLEYHFIMRSNVSGIYSYVVAANTGSTPVTVSELRNVYRFDASRLNELFNGVRQDTPRLYSELEALPKVQDETWQLPDGNIYSKYDFAGYQRATRYWGLGNGYGAWLVPASHEYYSGDALKQELLVHQDAIILNYLTGSHFGTPDMVAQPGFEKLYGPWLLYINQGSDRELLADARRRAEHERANWPYKWMDDTRYPQHRATVSGKVQTRAPHALVTLNSSSEDADIQTLGYLYHTRTNRDGQFTLHDVPAGEYRLSVYADGGTEVGLLAQQAVHIDAGRVTLDPIATRPDEPLVWAIGQADRKAGEFRFGDRLRQYHWQTEVPANLSYEIGKSRERNDWYYAQTRPGSWRILFTAHQPQKAYTLHIALAGASNSGMTTPVSTPQLAVKLNDRSLTTLRYDNDKAIYRGAMQSGRYHEAHIPLPAGALREGSNTLSLDLQGGMVMYDAITLTETPAETQP
ncbi:polysaccharide lyase family protein [Dickeya aquatica]|uniref:rhamnogalacturonan endolyase n=1 Tax=Dickeya aquatica TaxID=1401087 RepID=A0A375A7G5_9GAMM|nr:polysaccharide lyase family protein [Dickeya aquatica]SLM61960.1 rhamnogalacturonate lyase [Dickeya aquatica]